MTKRLTPEQKARNKVIAAQKRERYNNLIKAYKNYKASELGISPRKVRVRGQSESAQDFRKFYKLLADPKKPSNYRRAYAEMGFGTAFWVKYANDRPATQAEVDAEMDFLSGGGENDDA